MAAAAIAGLWIAFAATHMGLSSQRLRPRLVSALGARGFQGAYSVVALAIFVPLVSVYFDHKHAGPALWYLGHAPAVRWAVYGIMGAALTLAVGGLLRPSPAMRPGRTEAGGVQRVTRHPLFMGFGLYGLAHLLGARINAAELAFFAGFPIFAVLGCWHQDRRKLASADEDLRRFFAETPFLPFASAGSWRAIPSIPVPIALGIAGAVALRHYHPALFG